MQETRVWSLGREDPLEKEMATHSSILAWRIPWRKEPGRLQSMGSQRVKTRLSYFTFKLQHARLPCPVPSSRVCSNSCPLTQWSQPTISSSVAPFSACPQSFPASGSFPMSRYFTSGGQSIGASTIASVLPMSIQALFPLEFASLISLLSRGLSKVFSNTTVWKHQSFGTQPSLWLNSHIWTWLLEKP